MDDGQIPIFTVRTENEFRIRVKTCGVRVLPYGRGRYHLAGIGVYDRHFLIAADRKQSSVFLIESQSGRLLATREGPTVKYRELLRIDLDKLRLVFDIHEHATLVVPGSKLRLASDWDHSRNLAVSGVDSNCSAAMAIEGENSL